MSEAEKKTVDIKESSKDGDILNIVEQFIAYFEAVDKEETHDNSIIGGKCN